MANSNNRILHRSRTKQWYRTLSTKYWVLHEAHIEHDPIHSIFKSKTK